MANISTTSALVSFRAHRRCENFQLELKNHEY